MRAAVRDIYGGPDIIDVKELPKPKIKSKQVLIKVHATTVNRTDCAILTAKPIIMRAFLGLWKPKKRVLGTDFAGEIIETGNDIDQFKVGDRVFGFEDMGLQSQAEIITVDSSKIFIIPENIDYIEAAASLEGAHYAFTFFKKSNVKDGQKVLINGASGAIGSALFQFVKTLDVSISVTCNPSSVKYFEELGADKIFDYTKEDFTQDNLKYDFVFDTVGKSTFGQCKNILSENGIYISSEFGPKFQNVFYALTTPLLKGRKVIFPIPFKPEKSIPFISKQLIDNTFIPLIDRQYNFEDVSDAYRYVLSGNKIGNVILNLNEHNGK